ncbi:helix-turn-helix transcriptional regulator [Paracidovorax avenae]|uniref:helix-turn-helix transcriptional regulator n=1 Tax=Paracidovorax avenae TaxID=80867 RepID=UPI000D2087E4|nr:helix-turn-helix transcriptional regulator [Paracidovorax avenae]AVS95605.1 LuxR family transcriptional regulator [Paracidovorax avenae]AVT02274.1 LuxR family transcriptional regulator [Paracidovorax avenae]AVT05730.1 LuxR family transcriptional regulator [Paracidovorax avenae]AVT09182.1 LuxR family transcriptional regulator [Paracidovorax avenae]
MHLQEWEAVQDGPAMSACTRQAPARAMPAIGPLQAFSAGLLRLSERARQGAPQAMLRDALDILRTLVPFDMAWWGEVSAGTSQVAPRNWLHGSIGLSRQFAQEWNQLSMEDEFAQASLDSLGQVVVGNACSGQPLSASPRVEAFCERHGLFHSMAFTVALPDSGLQFFVCVYRKPLAPPFSGQDAALFGEFVPHLLDHWRHMLETLQSASIARAWDSYALADTEGRLLFLGLRVGQALAQAHPGWSGTALPPECHAALRQLPGSLEVSRSCRLHLEACGALVCLRLPSRQRKSPLAPREMSAALLYAHGHGYKAIAGLLGLSPATVRTYLRSAYTVLGVRNKVELAAALRGPRH